MTKTFHLVIWAALLPLVCFATVSAQEDPLTSVDHKVMKELTGVKETPNIVFHYRPDDVDDAALAKIVKINVDKFEQCEKLLKMKYNGRVHIFLYRDVDDLKKTTGASAVAFATGTVSIHQAMDFKSVHELTHIFALQFPRDEDSETDGFAVEGLATILAESDQNVPVQSWAAVYQSTSRIPDLVEFRRSWPEGAPQGVHPYHVAGSFVGYLIEEFGIEKVKHWYVNSTEAHMVFGKTLRRLERDWLAWLKKTQVETKHRDHVLAKLGLLRNKIPDSLVDAEGTNLFDGESISGFKAEDSDKWKVEEGRLTGTNSEAWTHLHTEEEFPANIGVRMKFRLAKGNAVKIRLNRSNEALNEAIFATWAIYLSAKGGGYKQAGDLKIKPGEWNEVVFVNDNGTGRLYLNGFLALESKGDFHTGEGALGIAIERGTLEVEELVAFEL